MRKMLSSIFGIAVLAMLFVPSAAAQVTSSATGERSDRMLNARRGRAAPPPAYARVTGTTYMTGEPAPPDRMLNARRGRAVPPRAEASLSVGTGYVTREPVDWMLNSWRGRAAPPRGR